MMQLSGRVAVITGGGSGIGAALANACAAAGMKVVIADVEKGAAERVAEELCAAGAESFPVEVDVRDAASVAKLADRTFVGFIRQFAAASRRPEHPHR